jgi:hypothetical protein
MKAGDEVLILRDGDLGSPAEKGLERAVDDLILAGGIIRVSDMEAGADPNSVLQTSIEGLRFIATDGAASPIKKLSLQGDIRRVSTLDELTLRARAHRDRAQA